MKTLSLLLSDTNNQPCLFDSFSDSKVIVFTDEAIFLFAEILGAVLMVLWILAGDGSVSPQIGFLFD